MTQPTMQAPQLVVDDFLDAALAQSMRAAVEAHFRTPERHQPDSHMVWNYWFVPGMYTYLRAQPERVIGAALATAFHDKLTAWSCQTLGLSKVTWPYLSLYVDGCKQGLHNDSGNGRFGFVYSLTRNDRRSEGGETLVWREDDYFNTTLHKAQAGESFYEKIAPAFNRLVLFDDRMPHAVQAVEGGMDPLEGRIVLHGHLSEGGPVVTGPVPREVVIDFSRQVTAACARTLGPAAVLFHGPVVFAFTVLANGGVGRLDLRLNRLKRLAGPGPGVADVVHGLPALLRTMRFPACGAETSVIFPIRFGAEPA